MDELPKQGSKAPWFLRQNFLIDLLAMRLGRVSDAMQFSRRGEQARAPIAPSRAGSTVG